MKTRIAVVVLGLACTNLWAADPAGLASPEQRLGYSMGHQLGVDFKAKEIEIDSEAFARGLKDGMGGAAAAMTEAEIQSTLQAYTEAVGRKRLALAEQNRKEGEAFLAANAKKRGVKTLPSGLQYKELKAGKGKSPTVSDTVVAHYRGTLINGKEFDSSYSRKEPATFPLRGVIKGWQEALPLMQEGGKMQIFVPSELAYGPRGAGRDIGPNSALIFEIELISVQPAGG